MLKYPGSKAEYLKLAAYARSIGVRIRTVSPKVTREFTALNPKAAHAFGKRLGKTIEIDRGLNYKVKRHTIGHEIVEFVLMKFKHMHYWDAHGIAEKWERKPVSAIIAYCERMRRS